MGARKGKTMYKIVNKKALNPTVTMMDIYAPLVAKKAQPGQFIILRVDEEGERIPLTVAGYDREAGTVKIIFQIVGGTTEKLNHKEEGEYLQDFVGPLGVATHLDGLKKVCIVGGGVGCAIALPIAQKLHEMGAEVTSIIGFRNKDLLILEDEFNACSDKLRVMTDDGSYGEHGNVTLPLKEMLEGGEKFDMIITIGPLIMMKFVVATAKPFGTPVTASMNPIMIDGTGMCGGCRLTLNIDGKKVTKFACVDGPDFNGYEIDFDEAMSRGRMYFDFERHAHDEACNLFKKEVQ
jgi:ferredoxin--NADP+ reductase